MWADDSSPGGCLLAFHQSFSPAVPSGKHSVVVQGLCGGSYIFQKHKTDLLSREKRKPGSFPEEEDSNLGFAGSIGVF